MNLNNVPSYNRIPLMIAIILTILAEQSLCASTTPTTVIQDLPYFGSHYIKLSSVSLDSTNEFGTGPRIYQRPLEKIYQKIKSYTILLSSYKCTSNGWFGFNISASITTDPTTAVNVTFLQTLNSKFSIIGVSVVIVTAPFDTVMKFYEFDMDIQNKVYDRPYTLPASNIISTYVKSMSQRMSCNYYGIYFSLSTTSSANLRLSFTAYCTHDSNSAADDFNVQAVVILVDMTTLYATPQLNFFSGVYLPLNNDVFGINTFGIDTVKFGKDINKKCILGFPRFDYINSNQPYFLFDLDPLIGVINSGENSYFDWGNYQSFCMQDLSCPLDYPFKKLNDRISCWDCNGGVISKQNTVPNCITYDNVFASIKYETITGAILQYCLKCTNCDDLYYAQNGHCKECNSFFPNCVTCQEKIVCLTCAVGYVIDSLNTCQLCNSFLQNCHQCSDQKTCTKCLEGFFLDSNQCFKCDDYMDYCKICSSGTNCLECNYPFILNNDQSGCTCLKGNILTGTCSEISGCISSHEINYVTLCYACDTQSNWNFQSSFDCTCQKGYSKLNDTYCQISCGDGLWTEEQCDDGNNLNGDGCSSKCLKQEFFECTNFYLQQSVCRYTPQITTSIYSLSRNFGTSQLILKLSFSPLHSIIMSNDWPSKILVNSSLISFDSHEFEDNKILVLHYKIIESVQNKTLKWTFSYNSDKFLSSPTSHQIPMKGMNAPLTYEAHYKHERIIEVISYVVGGLAFIVALVSMIKADSNIAFETVTTVLFVFYARILLHEDSPAMMYALGGLRVAEGFNEFFPDEHRDYKEYVNKNRFFLKSQLALMSLFTLAFLSLILLLKLAFQVKSFFNLIASKKLSLKKAMNSEAKKWKVFMFFNKAYNAYLSLDKNCFTPITIILLYRVLCTFNAFEDFNHQYPLHFSPQVTNTITLIFFVVIIYYMAVFAFIVSTLQSRLNVHSIDIASKKKVNLANHQPANFYADLYAMYLFVTSILVFFMKDFRQEKQNISQGIEGCAGVVLGYLIVLVLYKPYEKTFNMMAVVMNQIMKMVFLAFLLLIEKNVLSQLLIMVGCYLTLTLLIFIQILSIVRIKLSWTCPNPTQNQTQQLKQAFKLNSKEKELKQQRLHNNHKEPKGKKKLWINYEQNMYLYENIVKKERQQLMRKQEECINLYGELSRANRGRKNTVFGKKVNQTNGNSSQVNNNKWGHSGNMMQVSLVDHEKKDARLQLEKIKQRIRASGFAIKPKQQLYRLK